MRSTGANQPTEGASSGSRIRATVSIAPESSEQVALHGDGQISAELVGIKERVVTLVLPLFLPKNCRLHLELQEDGAPRAHVEGIVRRVQMIRTTPSYRVSVRVAGLVDLSPGSLASVPDALPDEGELESYGLDGGSIPRWTRHLIGDGVVSKARLEQLEEDRRSQGMTLEDALIEAGVAPDETISRCLALERCHCYIELDEFDVRVANAALVPEDIARRNQLFPLFAIDGVITLVMRDPTDLALIDQIRLRTSSQVDACMASSSALQALIERAYGAKAGGAAVKAPAVSPATSPEARKGEEPVASSHSTVGRVQSLVEDSARDGASDVHIEPERDVLRIRIRVDGILHERAKLPLDQHASIVSRIKVLANLDITETRRPQDGQFALRLERGNVDVRVSTIPTVWGETVVLRLLMSDGAPVRLSQIGMPSDTLARLEAFLLQPNGMILVTGPTGSGKTTTMYAALARLSTVERNVVTIEDPVEKRVPLLRQVQVNIAAGVTFADGLRSILRQDPDVIMVGEIRDRETAGIAIQAALTGHLVLSTLHTNTAAAAVVRLCEIGIPPFLITASLRAVISQRLTRRVCSACRREVEPDAKLAAGLGLRDTRGITFLAGAGCARCLGTGYKGRVGIYEMLSISPGLSAALVSGANRDVIEEEANRAMSGGLLQDGLRQVRAGLTTLAEVARVVGIAPAAGGLDGEPST